LTLLRKIVTFAICTSIAVFPSACGNKQKSDAKGVTITMEDGSTMVFELDENAAPITVENFVSLAEKGFYNGLTFHRIISGFMIQGGDPEGTGMGGSDKNIKGEFAVNGVENNISHERGTISMARAQDNNSASSQFFIVHEDSKGLDGSYAAFGKLVKGFETLDALAATEVSGDGQTPVKKPVIKSITVNR
jgi:peptidyl-prolyl cis-trans isomerase B (cyclophilin B)